MIAPIIARTRAALGVAALTLAVGGLALAQGNVLTGTWLLDVQTDGGGGTPTFKIVQDGEKLTGTYAGALGEAPLEGELKDGAFEIRFTASGGGGELAVKYSGTVEEDGTIKGKVDLGQLGSGTFTGKKQAEEKEEQPS